MSRAAAPATVATCVTMHAPSRGGVGGVVEVQGGVLEVGVVARVAPEVGVGGSRVGLGAVPGRIRHHAVNVGRAPMVPVAAGVGAGGAAAGVAPIRSHPEVADQRVSEPAARIDGWPGRTD